MDNQKMKIIYIAGTGHSGSTILDLLIGSSKNVFSTGELSLYNVYRRDIKYKGRHLGFTCLCGKDFIKCDLWSKISEQGSFKIKKFYSIWENLKILFFIFFPFFCRNKQKYSDDTDKLFIDFLKNNKEIKYVLDSSKDPRRLFYLLNNRNIEIYPIFLVREAEGVASSYSKKKKEAREGLKPKNYYFMLFQWLLINISISRMLWRHPRSIRIWYKDFASHPEKHIENLNKKLGLHISTKNYPEEINKTTYHNINGNLRVVTNPIKKIQYDDGWRVYLNVFERFISKILFYPFTKWWSSSCE